MPARPWSGLPGWLVALVVACGWGNPGDDGLQADGVIGWGILMAVMGWVILIAVVGWGIYHAMSTPRGNVAGVRAAWASVLPVRVLVSKAREVLRRLRHIGSLLLAAMSLAKTRLDVTGQRIGVTNSLTKHG